MKESRLREPYTHRTGTIPFSLHYTQVPKDDESALYCHWHTEIEIFYVAEGNLLFWVEDQQYNLNKGDAIVIPSNLLHRAQRVDQCPCSFYAVVFSPNLILDAFPYPEFSENAGPLLDTGSRSAVLLKSEKKLEEEVIFYLKQIFAFYRKEIRSCGLEICGLLFIIWQRLYLEHYAKLPSGKNSSTQNQEIKKVLEYIQEHYNENISLDDLAVQCHLSRGYFCRIFKEAYGIKPFEYINRYRIVQASRLLLTSDKKITQVCNECGFNGVSYFNRMFYKYTGMNPSTYRERL